MWSSRSTDFSFANSELKPATDDGEALSKLGKQIPNPLTSSAYATQDAFKSEDNSLQRHLAQNYQELGGSCTQTHLLESTFPRHEESKSGRQLVSNGGTEVPKKLLYETLKGVTTDEQDLSAVKIFYDCVSRLSVDDLETKSSFYPEQYSTESLFSERIFVIAMIQSQEDYRKQKYFLLFRLLIIMMTAARCYQRRSNLLNSLLPRLEFPYSVTNLSLSLKEDKSGQIGIESPSIHVAEDKLEAHMSDEDQILQDIEHLGCRKVFESDVTVLSRISSSSYHVLIGTRKCVEQKASFAAAGRQGENGYRDFCQDLRLLHSLRGCAGVVEFISVVLDKTGQHLKGYVYESPMIGSLSRLFDIANSQSKRIPWLIREIWSRQIIEAVSEVYKKDKVIGVLTIYNIGLRADGRAVLTRLKTSQRHIRNVKGAMPPELREPSKRTRGVAPDTFNFQTDIFQLGLILWLIAEHRPICTAYFCAKSACTTFLSHTCTADHANPVELPACCGGIPAGFTDIITRCRLPNSRARPSARSLIEALPYTGETTVGLFFALGIMAIVTRTAIRLRFERRLFVDDAFLLLACVCLSAALGLLIVFLPQLFLDEGQSLDPASATTPPTYEQALWFVQLTDAYEVLMWTVIYSVKFSFLYFFQLLTQRTTLMRQYRKIVMGLCVVTYIFSLCGVFIPCPQFNFGEQKCWKDNQNPETVAITSILIGLDIITDLLIIAIPIRLLRVVKTARMPLLQRAILGFSLCLGVFIIIVSLIRITGHYTHSVEGDTVFDVVWGIFWHFIEGSVAVSMVSITAFPKLFFHSAYKQSGAAPPPVRRGHSREALWARRRKTSEDIQEGHGGLSLPTLPSATLTGMRTLIRGGQMSVTDGSWGGGEGGASLGVGDGSGVRNEDILDDIGHDLDVDTVEVEEHGGVVHGEVPNRV
ncbi:hypothetical protein MMC17_002552 [Xylographa soralifera]|nr:hypothetical protein [Xylographa soralifera]